MGVLQLPRYYFQGYNYWNPSTFNNNDYNPTIDTYDPPNAKLNCPYLETQGLECPYPYRPGLDSASDFKDWSMDAIPYSENQDDKVPPAEWDYYGGNQCGFVTQDKPNIQDPNFSKPTDFTYITGFTDNSGQYSDSTPWLNLPLQFNLNTGSPAKLVDINPTAFWSSQIFADSFTLGSSACGFSAPVNYRMHSRWIGSTHNYNTNNGQIIAGNFSAVFQTCLHKDEIEFYGTTSQLQQAMDSDDVAGLMVRFTNYDTIYFQGSAFTPADQFPNMEVIARLYQEYADALKEYQEGKTTTKPQRPINRAYSRVVGWIGLWKQGELVSVPEGRFLIPYQNTSGTVEEIKVQAKNLPAKPNTDAENNQDGNDNYYVGYYQNDKLQPPKALLSLGPAVVEVKLNDAQDQVERLTVDLGTAMPEDNNSGEKADFGTVQLGLQTGGGFQPIATLPNDKTSYEQTAGVVDITDVQGITANDIQNNPLAIQVETYDYESSSQTTVSALIETPVTAQTDQRGIYANQPNPSWNPDYEMETFTVKVQYYGGATIPTGTTMALNLNGSEDAELFYQDSSQTFQPYTEAIPISSDGEVTIGVKALQASMPNISFEPTLSGQSYSGASFSSLYAGDTAAVASAFYAVVRCLPFHNSKADDFESFLNHTPAPTVPLVNQKVFQDVYATYSLMYPVMDFIDSAQKFQEWRGRILHVTDPTLFESAKYMPVTRALSAGQRRIIELYCEYLSILPESERSHRKPSPNLGHGLTTHKS